MRKLVILILICSMALLLAGLIPDPAESVQFRYPVGTILEQLSGEIGGDNTDLITIGLMERMQNSNLILEVTVPDSVLVGRKARVQMNGEQVPSEESGENREPEGETNLLIRAQLVLPRQFVEPAGYSTRKLSGGAVAAYRWNLFTDQKESLRGKLWVYLDLSDGKGSAVEYPLLAKDIEIPARTILGMSLAQSRVAVMILIASGLLIVVFTKLIGKIKGVLKIVMIK